MNISNITKANFYLKLFSITKIPLIWFCRPQIVKINEEIIEVKIKLNRRTKNHLNSMYFGALSVGADITGGFLAMHCIEKSQKKISLIFKDFKADFLKRPLGNVHFICNQGYEISELVNETIKSKDRQNLLLYINATVPSISNEIVAKFQLTLSLKSI
tara:strand:- start:1418 stop:1891 length:474 start_codon:yes stop_codon:yes gene_type:complete